MQLSDDKKGKLNRLEKKLYSRNAPNMIDPGRSRFSQDDLNSDDLNLKEKWDEIDNDNFDKLAKKFSNLAQSRHSIVKKIFIFSSIFFLIAAGVSVFVFTRGINMISSKNVDIKVVGPLSVGGGQEVSFDVNIINNNNVDLNSAALIIKYPEGTRLVSDLSKELTQDRFSVGTIKTGQSYNQNIKVVFFGEKEDIKQIKISLEYRVENSSALFQKEKNHEISISSAPVIITSTYPKEVNSNQDIVFSVEVASNSKDKINNFLVNVEYPFGFVFSNASPAPSFGDNTWQFSDFIPGDKKTIVIRGNIIGQDNEERVFKVSAGTASDKDERIIAVPFSESTESVLVKKPFIGVDVLVDGKSGDVVGKGGKQSVVEIKIKNNISSKLFNTFVTATLSGGAFDQLSVIPSNEGFFQSSNNTILWDKRSVPDLDGMDPGSEERLSFRITPLLYENIKDKSKANIEMIITTKGERITETGSSEEVKTIETRKIVLATDVALTSKVVRSSGNLENSGPIPPKVNEPTTYTIVWSVSNSFNQVGGAMVKATLPSYVKWTGLKNPSNEILSYDDSSKEIIWNIGSILPNSNGTSVKTLYFQLELIPSTSQIGQAPIILGESIISGTDKITGTKIESKTSSVSTNFFSDPEFSDGDDRVTQ